MSLLVSNIGRETSPGSVFLLGQCLQLQKQRESGINASDKKTHVMPSSIRVPRLLANIIRSQYKGSEVSEDTIPYKGI